MEENQPKKADYSVNWLIFWLLVILAIVGLARWLAGGRVGDGPARGIDILKARYAKGEITKEQFEQMKRDIGEG